MDAKMAELRLVDEDGLGIHTLRSLDGMVTIYFYVGLKTVDDWARAIVKGSGDGLLIGPWGSSNAYDVARSVVELFGVAAQDESMVMSMAQSLQGKKKEKGTLGKCILEVLHMLEQGTILTLSHRIF
jgi:hypothetical protein